MTPKDLLIWPDAGLRKKCAEVTEFDAKLKQLVVDLHTTMMNFDSKGDLPDAAGLSASQVSIYKRVFVYKLDGEATCMINPKIIEAEGMDIATEGCLSFPGIYVSVKRAKKITVEFQDVNGKTNILKTEGFTARVISHECDHLDGITFLHALSKLKRDMFTQKMKKAKKRVETTKKRLAILNKSSLFTQG